MANPLVEISARFRLHSRGTDWSANPAVLVARMRAARATQIEAVHVMRNALTPHPSASGATETPIVADRMEMLRRRLQTAASALIPRRRNTSGEPLVPLLRDLVDAARRRPDDSGIWLILTAGSATFPSVDEVQSFRRDLDLAGSHEYLDVLLQHSTGKLDAYHAHYRSIRLVGGVVADVDFCAKNNYNSGIQRVTRVLMHAWRDEPTVTPVAWMQNGRSYRTLASHERERVCAWSDRLRHLPVTRVEDPHEMVVPWGAIVFFPEVASPVNVDQIAGIAACSGNEVHAIAYDMIPSLSGSFVTVGSSAAFALYLSALKYATQVIAISAAVGEEFGGFVDALAAQGLPGPKVTVAVLPDEGVGETAREIEKLESGEDLPAHSGPPVVLSVGSFEPRKNQIALLNAAELLWQKGREFSVVLVGGGALQGYRDVYDRYNELVVRGRTLSMASGVTDAQLATAYERADATVFLSLQEGFGLPLVESFAAGVPVVHTNYGSVAEVGAAGGGVPVDPRNIYEIADALERVLFEPGVRDELRAQIAARPKSRWAEYTAYVWDALHSGAEGEER